MLRFAIALLVVPALTAQSPDPRPQFEVASVKRNPGCAGRPRRGGPGSLGRFNMECTTLHDLIQMAYGLMANGDSMSLRIPEVAGGPSWMSSETWDIEGKAADTVSYSQMGGPMLQTLLEGRFQLKLHRDTQEAPVYILTVGKGGIKMQPTRLGSCIDLEAGRLPPPGTLPQDGPPLLPCSQQQMHNTRETMSMTSIGTTMEKLAAGPVALLIGRPILDRTGITGRYDVRIEFAWKDAGAPNVGDPGVLPPSRPAGPSVFQAFERLGLKLEPGKGPVEILVIDHVEQPREN